MRRLVSGAEFCRGRGGRASVGVAAFETRAMSSFEIDLEIDRSCGEVPLKVPSLLLNSLRKPLFLTLGFGLAPAAAESTLTPFGGAFVDCSGTSLGLALLAADEAVPVSGSALGSLGSELLFFSLSLAASREMSLIPFPVAPDRKKISAQRFEERSALSTATRQVGMYGF